MALINKVQEYQDLEEWSNNVQKLKGYRELKENVEYWAKQKDRVGRSCIQGSYEIVYDDELGWCVDVDGDVSFLNLDIIELPFKFRNVSGRFDCCYCKCLTSLTGFPICVGKVLKCSFCKNLTYDQKCQLMSIPKTA